MAKSIFELGLSVSPSIVKVRILNAGNINVPARYCFEPVSSPDEWLHCPIYCFLIEHTSLDGTLQRVVFDLGIRKDPLNTCTPVMRRALAGAGSTMVVEKDISEQLVEGGVNLESIDAIIWSHAHVDHTGDIATFPSSTNLVVGDGFSSAMLPLYPNNADSPLFEGEIAGRKLIELSFANTELRIAGLRAHDYFGDGSFYLLDTPGHMAGHITGLARVTADPLESPTFIFMGADSCHHVGQLRPTHLNVCPAAILERLSESGHLSASCNSGLEKLPSSPPLQISKTNGSHADPDEALRSLSSLQVFDAHPDVFVVLAHDNSLVTKSSSHLDKSASMIKLFPEDANDWKREGWKDRCKWAYLDTGNPFFRF